MTSIIHDPEMLPYRKMQLVRNIKDEIVLLMQVLMKTSDFQTRKTQESKPINLHKGERNYL